MRSTARIISTIALGLFVAVTATGFAQRAGTPPAKPAANAADATARIVAAAQAVVASLDEAGRAKIQFPFDGPQKRNGPTSRRRCFSATAYASPI